MITDKKERCDYPHRLILSLRQWLRSLGLERLPDCHENVIYKSLMDTSESLGWEHPEETSRQLACRAVKLVFAFHPALTRLTPEREKQIEQEAIVTVFGEEHGSDE